MYEIDLKEIVEEWQGIVDLMARIIQVPAALIMRLHKGDLEVFVSSNTEGNPYKVGEKEVMENSGLYCETVVKRKSMLKIPNALIDDEWKNNPDIDLNMISYLGFPLLYPSGEIFGTICVLDNKENHYTREYEELLQSFKRLIERELEVLTKNVQLKISAETDPLTGVFNRLAFIKKINKEIKRAKRYGRTLSLLMFDLDDFKTINDNFGHQMGDAVLKQVTQKVSGMLRESDMLCRYGGEEFIIALPETDMDSALILGKRILEKISKSVFNHNDTNASVTVSIGIATQIAGDSLDDIIKRADDKLYEAKSAGKNQVKS